MELSDLLRDAIRKDPRSQAAIAKEAGTTAQHLSSFMSGARKYLSCELMERVLAALGMEVELIRTEKKKPPRRD